MLEEDNVVDDSSGGAASRSVFVPASVVKRIYAGSLRCAVCPNGWFASAALDTLNFVDMSKGYPVKQIVLEEDLIGCFAVRPVVSPDGGLEVVIASKSLQLHHYRLDPEPRLVRSWKAHTMPALSMAYDPTGTVIACGCSDGRVFVYDVAQGHATHALRGHSSAVLRVGFHPDVRRVMLVTASQDATVRLWDLRQSESRVLKAHVGAVSDFCFVSSDVLVSVGRDRVLVAWDVRKGVALFTTALYEELASVVLLSARPATAAAAEGPLVMTGGADGVLKVFDVASKRVVAERKEGEEGLKFAVEQIVAVGKGTLAVVTRDQNLLMYDASTLERKQQIVGDLDEVVDARFFGASSDKVAVATNSRDIKVWHVTGNDWELLGGHTNTVLALDVSRSHRRLCSGGKDAVVRVWDVSQRPAVALAALEGHTDSINAVAWGGDAFVVSGGKDRTLKVWKLQADGRASSHVYTCIGHAAEINCIDVSPNEQLIASGGADKRILLWTASKPLGAAPAAGRKLLGHKRGVWDVRFSPVDRRLASCSGDRTVRIWNAGTGECLRVLEGHLAATLKVRWISSATQLVSSGSDGLLKVWNVFDGATAATVGEEEHDGGKLWALDVARDGELIVSGGSDGSVFVWKDATKESTVSALRVRQQDAEQKQELSNLVLRGELAQALALALQLDHRSQCKKIVEKIREQQQDPRQALVDVIKTQMSPESLDLLIRLCAEWNKNAHHSATAHAVMEAVFLAVSAERLSGSSALKASLESWMAFSQRHVQRVVHLVSSSYVIDLCLEMMGGGPALMLNEFDDHDTNMTAIASAEAPEPATKRQRE